MHRRVILALFSLIALAVLSLNLSLVPPTSAAGESYTLTLSSDRVQEYSPAGVTLSLIVANATVGGNYQFNFTVLEPSGTPRSAVNSTIAGSSSFTTSVVYPRDFGSGASTKYVGNYTIDVTQDEPAVVAGVATGQFKVGLTDSITYERTYQVSTRATGYSSFESVTIRLLYDSLYVQAFPRTQYADSAGNVNFPWQIPADADTGTYVLDLTGASTAKSPADTQTFTVHPTNTSIPGLTVNSPTISRTLTQQFLFAPQYPGGQRVQTGQARLRIAESDGVTYVYANGTYDSLIGTFRATYKLPRDAMSGIWIATIDANMFDDGYGNGGPSLTVVAGFYVQPASFEISITSTSQSFGAGDVIPVYALIKYPDGTILSSGTVTARLLRSGVAVGSPITLSYISGQQQWAGSYQVGPNDPSGIWLVRVDASDQNGNMGEGTSSAVVSIPPSDSPPPLTTGLNTSTFLLIAAAAAAGAMAALGWALLTNRKKFTKSQVKLDLRLVDKEVDQIQDSEFFQSVKKQVQDRRSSESEKPPPTKSGEEDEQSR